MIAQAWLFSQATEILAGVDVGGVPAFTWATFVLVIVDAALLFILHQHRRQLALYGSKIAYHERLSAYYIFIMQQQGIDVAAVVPKEEGKR